MSGLAATVTRILLLWSAYGNYAAGDGLVKHVLALVLVMCVSGAEAAEGIASVYGNEHGQSRRADGHVYNPWSLGFACRSWPLGSLHRVTVVATGRSMVLVCFDRGPWVRGRIIDLSMGAARSLGVRGLARVRVD